MTNDPRSAVETDRDPHTLGRFVAVALVFPAALTLVGLMVQMLALPRVPATIATHWDASGTPDGFAPAWVSPVLTVVLGLGIPLLVAASAVAGLRRGDRGPSYRFLGAVSAATSALIVTLMMYTFVIQIDVTDPATVVLPLWPALVIVFALAVAVGIAAWFIQPHDYPDERVVASAEPLSLQPGERAVWMRTASIARPGLVTITAAVLLVSAFAIGAWVTAASLAVAWILTAIALLLLVLVATTTSFHVRVDERGLSVDSVLGLPRFDVPVGDIAQAAAVTVNPMGEFGGWGLRLAVDGRFGVVLRAGQAIEVTRISGRRFVVTVDDAATGAALLEALRLRSA